MTLANWIGIGVTVILVVAFIIIKVYVAHKFREYDGLGGIVSRNQMNTTFHFPDEEQNGTNREN